MLDARGDYTRASKWIREANALTLESRRGQNDFVPADHERFVDNVIKHFDAAFFARTTGMGSESRRPVFIFGLPRSGTSLIEQVLASHSHVHGAGELRLGRQSFEAIPLVTGRNAHPMECIADLDADSIRRLAGLHLERLMALAPAGAERVVDKMPDNYMYVGLMKTLFPKAVFIHCRRDLRDVALSCWMTDFRSMSWPSQTTHIAAQVQAIPSFDGPLATCVASSRSRRWITKRQLRISKVSHGGWSRCVASSGSRPASNFTATSARCEPPAWSRPRRPVYKSSVGRYKHYEAELADLFESLPTP